MKVREIKIQRRKTMKKNLLAASLAAILFFQRIAPTVLLAKTTGEIDSVTKIERIERRH